MPSNSERVFAAQRALLQTSQDIGLRALDGVARLFEIQVQAARTVLTTSTERIASMAQPDMQTTAAAGLASLQPDPAGLSSYLRQVADAASATGSELVQLSQQQAVALQSLINEFTAMVWQTTPINSDAFVAMMRNPFAATQSAFRQATDAVNRSAGAAAQAVDAATQAAEGAARADGMAAQSSSRAF